MLFLPFWLSVVLAAAAMFLFPLYLEAVFIFFISDLLYGAPEGRYLGITMVSAILGLVLLAAIEFTKKKIRLYPEKSQ